jgi:hypothetical protein
VDAVELLAGDAPFIADTSAWILRNDRAVADAAVSAVSDLAERSDGYHNVPLTDALIAAAAAALGARRAFPIP